VGILKKFVTLTKLFVDWKKASNDWFRNQLATPNNNFQQVTPSYLSKGSFYYMKYDLAGLNKSTRIEQYSIIFMVEYKPNIDEKIFWAINFNFLPSDIRRNFFLGLIDNKHDDVINANDKAKDWVAEQPIPNISYKRIISELARYGIVYTKSVRAFRVDLINELYGISTKNIEKLISLDVRPISGMDDLGIAKVLSGKLTNEGVEVIAQDITQDYTSILEDLKERFKNIYKEIGNL
jgi:hypothetical protein